MHRLVQALLRVDLRFFIRKVFATVSPGQTYLHNWHVDAIAHQLTRVRSGESRRLLINQPPRSLKSICVSVAYVAWLLGHDATRRIIVASYSGDFAAELHRRFRMVIDSQWYAAVFPDLLAPPAILSRCLHQCWRMLFASATLSLEISSAGMAMRCVLSRRIIHHLPSLSIATIRRFVLVQQALLVAQ